MPVMHDEHLLVDEVVAAIAPVFPQWAVWSYKGPMSQVVVSWAFPGKRVAMLPRNKPALSPRVARPIALSSTAHYGVFEIVTQMALLRSYAEVSACPVTLSASDGSPVVTWSVFWSRVYG